jgi:hypothetical protein
MQGLVMQQNHCDRDGWETDTQVTYACELLVILTKLSFLKNRELVKDERPSPKFS